MTSLPDKQINGMREVFSNGACVYRTYCVRFVESQTNSNGKGERRDARDRELKSTCVPRLLPPLTISIIKHFRLDSIILKSFYSLFLVCLPLNLTDISSGLFSGSDINSDELKRSFWIHRNRFCRLSSSNSSLEIHETDFDEIGNCIEANHAHQSKLVCFKKTNSLIHHLYSISVNVLLQIWSKSNTDLELHRIYYFACFLDGKISQPEALNELLLV